MCLQNRCVYAACLINLHTLPVLAVRLSKTTNMPIRLCPAVNADQSRKWTDHPDTSIPTTSPRIAPPSSSRIFSFLFHHLTLHILAASFDLTGSACSVPPPPFHCQGAGMRTAYSPIALALLGMGILISVVSVIIMDVELFHISLEERSW